MLKRFWISLQLLESFGKIMAKIIKSIEWDECTPASASSVRVFREGRIENETIEIRSYKNARGAQINIGMSQEVQDLLGLPFKDFDVIRKKQEHLDEVILNLNQKYVAANIKGEILNRGVTKLGNAISKATFLERLVFLLTGKLFLKGLDDGSAKDIPLTDNESIQ